jgi:CRISPR-associated endonuclease/helicase Cas3
MLPAGSASHRGADGRARPLADHLAATARLAAGFAAAFGAGEWARLLGLWHDLGKHDPEFQRYLARVTGEDGHLEPDAAAPKRGPEHSIAGALHAIARLGDPTGRPLAFAIAGHHAGLPDWQSTESGDASLKTRLDKARQPDRDMLARAIAGGAPPALLDAPRPATAPQVKDAAQLAFLIRMLFSALVDADFLDTEGFFEPDKGTARAGWPPLAALLPVLDAYVDALAAQAARERPGPVNEARTAVLAACRERAALAPGLFTLTVPTGGGKTLASLAFALRHAQAHGLRRVVYAIPYTSIIEQTADVFRGVFAPLGEVLIEHHSSLPPDRESNRARLASENWDAPLVVTTNVQLLESLFAARPSRCRKLHNLAASVIVLDEAQLLPVELLRPVLFALDELMRGYGASVVLSTATQPALLARDKFPGLTACARELAPDPAALHRALRRTRVERLHGLARAVDWPGLAALLAAEARVLAIVDRRDAARDLLDLMPEGTFQLSALMCPAHRSDVLACIKKGLADPRAAVRVVATQLVEAGVDLDFPVVFRAVAGLDSIAQAAGRCNREGRLDGLGRVVVFRPPQPPPKGISTLAAQIGVPLLAEGDDALTPEAFTRYFGQLYWAQGDLDVHRMLTGSKPLLADRSCEFGFRTAAARFKLIPDEQVPLIVPYGDASAIADEIGHAGVSRERMRRAQRFTVGVYRKTAAGLLACKAAREIAPGLLQLDDARLYTRRTGLDVRRLGTFDPSELIV